MTRNIVLMIRLMVFLSRRRFDIIHINPSLNYASLLRDGFILLVLKAFGYRNILVWFHGWDGEVEKNIRHNRLLRAVFAKMFGTASRIAVLAPEFQRALVKMGIRNDVIVYATTMFDGKTLPRNAPGSGEPVILFMSRFDARKGVYELLSAFANLARDFPGVKLVFAGDGEENGRLREAAKMVALGDRILFPGYVTGNEKAELLSRCMVFALPTYYAEGMPVALLEAMACGKPLLTTRAGGIKHIVQEPDNGIVLDRVTPHNVEAGLRRLLGDPDFCRISGTHNAEYAWKHFERNVTAQIESMYDAITQS